MQKRQWYVFAAMSFIMGQIFKIGTFTNMYNSETAFVINHVLWGLLMANAIACMICAWLEKE